MNESNEMNELYADSCGIIGLGESYNNIIKMMGDNLIPYIIGYHRSGLTAIIAENTKIKHAADYTPVQNTNELLGYPKE